MKAIVVLTLVLTAPAGAFAQALNEATLKAEKAKGDQLQNENKHKEALAIRLRLVDAAIKLYGADAVETARYLCDLGETYGDLEQFDKCETAIARSLQIREMKLGKDHPDVADSLDQLGGLRQAQGEFAKAEAIYDRGLKIREAKLGKDHLDTAKSLELRAWLHFNLGQYDKAEQLFLRCLQIREQKLGANDLDVAVSLHSLGVVYKMQGLYDKAETFFKRSLKIKEANPDKQPLGRAATINYLGLVYEKQGKYAECELHYRRAFEIRRATLGEENLSVAESLNNLALINSVMGQSAAAEGMYQRCLQIQKSILGKDHPNYAFVLHNLAGFYHNTSQWPKAEQLYLRVLQIQEGKIGKNHPDTANTLNSLAELYKDMGQYAKAEPIYLRSLAAKELTLGKNHPSVASVLTNLAKLYALQGRYTSALPLYERIITIQESSLGKDHPSLAVSLSSLATLHENMGEFSKAELLYLRVLAIQETKFGKDHPAVATTVNNIGFYNSRQGFFEKARPWLERALHIGESRSSDNDPGLINTRDNLAFVYEATGQTKEALRMFDRARRASFFHVTRVLPVLSEKEQATFLKEKDIGLWVKALSLGARHADDPQAAELSAAWLINAKAIAQRVLAQGALRNRDANDAALRDLSQRLFLVRKELGQLALTPVPKGQDAQRQLKLKELGDREQDLAKQLRQAGSAAGEHGWIEVEQLRRNLPDDAVSINIAQFKVTDFTARAGKFGMSDPHYLAWIIPKSGPVRIIDLGLAAAIDTDITKARQALKDSRKIIRLKGEAEAETALREPMEALAKTVLHPMLPHIGTAKNWIISPDSNLWLTPWAALPLPDGKYAVEDHTISYVISGRDLVEEATAKTTTSAPVILADPDFNTGLDKLAPVRSSDTRGIAGALGNILRLPGTAVEALAIKTKLQQYAGAAPEIWTDEKASVGQFLQSIRPKVLVLSTHGYFEAAEDDSKEGQEKRPRLENPLLRCGLLLAGCNNAAKAKEGGDNGVLTGLQIVGADLRGTELVVLSACETGLGDVRNGEGVAGLRQAFQLAGAKCVVATLWQVPDAESAQLMTGFFDQLAEKQTKAEALRNAQLALIKARRDKTAAAHPYYWAAYTVTGK